MDTRENGSKCKLLILDELHGITREMFNLTREQHSFPIGMDIKYLGTSGNKMDNKTISLKDQIKELQTLRIQEILEDDSIDKLAKLKLLKDEKLFDVARWLQSPLQDWESELEVIVNKKQPYAITDSIFSPSEYWAEKYQTIFFDEFLESYFESVDWEEIDGLEVEPTDYRVVTDRSFNMEIRKTKEEIVDKVFEFAVANKLIGYINQW